MHTVRSRRPGQAPASIPPLRRRLASTFVRRIETETVRRLEVLGA